MAALTWRDVAAPNLGNPQDSINSAAKLLASSTGGLSGALTQFGDQQALQQLAQYSDAQKLQADIQSGRFNTANASGDALASIMGRPASLIENQTNQQQAAYRKELNPLLLASQGTSNEQANYNLFQDKDAQTRLENFTRPNETTDRTRLDATWNRTEDTRKLLDTAQVDFNTRLTDGSLNTVNQARDLLKSLSGGPKEVTDFYTKALSSRFPDLIAAPVASPLASGIGSFGSVQVPGATGGAVAPTQSTLAPDMLTMLGSADTSAKLPSGMMASILQQETGGKQDFITDPAKYHYPLNAEGKRIAPQSGKESTAFGPYGILESTAKDPGFGVTPLKDKSLPEQTRFASEYLAARIKAAGGDVQKGLAGYGEGVDYSNSVMKRVAAGNVPTTQQLSNTSAASIAQNSMAKVSANTPEVERWVNSISTPGNGAIADVAAELKKGSLSDMDLGRIRQRLMETAAATKTTGDYRLAGELLKASAGGDTSLNIFGPGPMGWQSDSNNTLLAANIEKYNKRSTTTDAIQAGRSLDQGSAALAETQKQVEALKAYRDAKKIELAKGVYGVTQDDVTKADVALNQALGTAQQIQLQIESFRPKTDSEVKPPATAPVEGTPTAVSAPVAASLLAAASKSEIPVKSAGRNRGYELDIPETIRNPAVSYYQQIPNPLYSQLKQLKGKSFSSKADAEKAYKDALKS